MADIHPALRAQLDCELSTAVTGLVQKAADLDGMDIVEANVELANDFIANLPHVQLAAAAAALALRLHRRKLCSGEPRVNAQVITLPKPTRTAADSELDLAPCGNAWGPLECAAMGRRPGLHVCWTWSGWPHICRCTRCEVGSR